MVKVISLSNNAYEKLKDVKGDKSFSEIVIELLEEKKPRKTLKDFFGIWKDDAAYWENFKKEIRRSREGARMREIRI